MRGRGWKVYLAVLLPSTAAYFLTQPGGWGQIWLQVAIGYTATAAILIGARRNAAGERGIWWCFAVGVFGNCTGILVEGYLSWRNPGFGFPSWADLFYLSLYPAVAIGLARLIRKRTAQRDWGTLVDATTVTAGLGLLAWIFMIRPAAADPSIGLLGHMASVSYPVGDVVLVAMTVRHQITDGLAIAVGSLTLILLVVTRMAQLLRQLEQQSRLVRELSHTDELTGLPNRRAWTVELPRAIEHARRHGVSLSVAMLDLDHFKQFNDSYGHPAGDRLLKAAGAAWQERLRGVDYLARYGGEEFIVLLPDADSTRAGEVVDRLRDVTPLGQTFSAGVATWDGRETSDELVARADTGLYQAKQSGRNRTLAADPTSTALT